MKLSNGREVSEYLMDNGATHIEMADGGDMSEAEWQEYAAAIHAMSLEQSRQRLARRKAIKLSLQCGYANL